MFPSVSGVSWRLCALMVFAGLGVVSPFPTAFADPPDEWLSPRSAEFAGVIDKVSLGFRDTAAFVALLKQVRSSPSGDLIKKAHRDLSFQELFTQPSLHRGDLVEVRGFAQRVYSSKSSIGTKGELFEVWITIPDKSPGPFACVVEELPPGFPFKSVVSAPVVFRGFFHKVISYQVEEVRRGAPLLVGRLELAPQQEFLEPARAGQDNRLPSGADQRRVVPAIEDQFKVEVREDDRLTVDGHPIARQRLAEEVKLLAEQTLLNARLVGLRIDAQNGLPAVVSFRAPPATPSSMLLQLLDVWQARGFRRFQFKLKLGGSPANSPRPTRRDSSVPARKESDLPAGIRTLPIVLLSDGKGQIGRAELGEHVLQGFESLHDELGSILKDPDLPFDQASVEVDPALNYSELVRVIDACIELDLTKLSFTPVVAKHGK